VQLVDDSFFKEEVEEGHVFYVRRGNFMTEYRTKDILDEVEQSIKEQKTLDEAEAKRDMTYEEFLQKYAEHIEGKVDADDRGRPFTAEGAESKEDGRAK